MTVSWLGLALASCKLQVTIAVDILFPILIYDHVSMKLVIWYGLLLLLLLHLSQLLTGSACKEA